MLAVLSKPSPYKSGILERLRLLWLHQVYVYTEFLKTKLKVSEGIQVNFVCMRIMQSFTDLSVFFFLLNPLSLDTCEQKKANSNMLHVHAYCIEWKQKISPFNFENIPCCRQGPQHTS